MMGSVRRKQYADDDLVLALASGERSYTQIAKDVGLSRGMVAAIARGEKRPMLQERIQAATAAFREQGCRLASRMVSPAIARLVHMIGPSSDAPAEVQRKAAGDLFRFAFNYGLGASGGRGYGGWPAQPGAMFHGLSGELRERVLDELGAPEEDAEEEDG